MPAAHANVMRMVCVLVIMMTTAARADGLAVVAGVGVRQAWLTSNDGPGDDNLTPALGVTAGYRVVPSLALGVHVAATWTSGSSSWFGTLTGEKHDWTIVPIDLAAAAQFEEGRFTVAPWVGLHRSVLRGSDASCSTSGPDVMVQCTTTPASVDTTALGFGVTASMIVDPGVPAVVVLDVQSSTEGAPHDTAPKPRFRYSAITLGVAYRR